MALSAVKKEPAKPKPGEAAPAAAAEAAPKASSGKKGKKILVIALALTVLGGGGGAAAWWYLHRDAGHSAAKVEPEKPPVFAPLETFTVNLQHEDVSQFAQVGLTLRMVDEAAVAQLKLRMPEVRDRILLMLSAKKPAELLTLEGKRKLAEEIKLAVNEIVAPEAAKKAAAQAAEAAKRAATSQQKPAPAAAPAQPAEGQEAAPQAEAAEAEAAAETPAPVALPVTGVLFTSFIIQ